MIFHIMKILKIAKFSVIIQLKIIKNNNKNYSNKNLMKKIINLIIKMRIAMMKEKYEKINKKYFNFIYVITHLFYGLLVKYKLDNKI